MREFGESLLDDRIVTSGSSSCTCAIDDGSQQAEPIIVKANANASFCCYLTIQFLDHRQNFA